MAAKVKLLSPGMRALLKSPGVRAELERRARPVMTRARTSAPVATGAYQQSIRFWSTTTDRAVARVGSDVDHAWVVEAKTGNLARALDAAGGA